MTRSISQDLRRRIRSSADNRCGYCLAPQRLVLGQLEIEHIRPVAAGGTDDESNLWLACRLCNHFKGTQTECFDPISAQRIRLFNPRRQPWSEHFNWSKDGTQIVGLTPCGRATVLALRMNNLIAVRVRQLWVAAGWHPPSA